MNKLTIPIILVLMCFSQHLMSQDLINRTRNNQKLQYERAPNGIANRVKSISKFESVEVFSFRPKQKSTGDRDVVYLDLAPGYIDQFEDAPIELSVPVSDGKEFVLQLYPSKVTGQNYSVTNGTGLNIGGQRTSQFYHGIVKDDPSSLAAVSVSEGEIQAIISDAFGNYNLGPVRDKSEYALFEEAELPVFPFDCGVGEFGSLVPDNNALPKEEGGAQQKSTGNECVKVYIEADYRTYENFGYSTTAVADFIEGMFNVITAIYASENIAIELSELAVWTVDDPYSAETNVITALNYLNANIGSFNGDLFHLVSAIGNSGSFSGVANIYCNDPQCNLTKVTALCQADPFAVSQTQLFYEDLPAYSWTVNVFAHEMGHNLGSPHTHACQWGPGEDSAIDGCVSPTGGCTNPGVPGANGGTIMSYCHLNPNVGISLSNGFGTEVGDHIRGQVGSAACLTDCSAGGCDPIVTVNTNPVSGTYEASQMIETMNGISVETQAVLSAPEVEINEDFTVDESALLEILTTGCNL